MAIATLLYYIRNSPTSAPIDYGPLEPARARYRPVQANITDIGSRALVDGSYVDLAFSVVFGRS